MTAAFELHTRLAADCIRVGRLPISMLLLMNDARYPWFILVPQRRGVTEIFQLPESDQCQLWQGISMSGTESDAKFSCRQNQHRGPG